MKMAGYEDLTSDQLMLIVWLMWSSILIFAISYIIGKFFIYRASRFIYLKIEKEIVKKIESEIIDKKPVIVKVKEWLDKRKQLKEEKLLGKIG